MDSDPEWWWVQHLVSRGLWKTALDSVGVEGRRRRRRTGAVVYWNQLAHHFHATDSEQRQWRRRGKGGETNAALRDVREDGRRYAVAVC